MMIGDRLRDERSRSGLTQRELALRVGVTFPYISKIENNRELPSPDLLYRMADVFGLDGDELVIQSGAMPEHLMEWISEHPATALAKIRAWMAR